MESSSLTTNLLEELCTSQVFFESQPNLIWICHLHDTKQNIILKSGDDDSSNFVPLFIRVGDRLVGGRGYSSHAFQYSYCQNLHLRHLPRTSKALLGAKSFFAFVALHDVGARALLFHKPVNFHSYGIHF